MSNSIYSPSWYRVADLTPRLRSHVRISRHHYRGQPWYVLQDSATARYHRFSPAAYFMIGLMDGHRKIDTIWEAANIEYGDDAPDQDEVIQLLGQLHASDVLQCDVPPDSLELFRRFERDKLTKLKRRLMSPLSIRIPILDPDRFLSRFESLARPLFSWGGLFIWTIVVGIALLLAVSHWTDLTHNISDRVLNTHNLLLVWMIFPFVKILHELGHAFATKIWGGEVHEMGITLLVLTPVPYVDASSSSAFPDKHKRMAVAGAGMMVELFIAALALFVWLNVESGIVSSLMFNIMLISGISTLLFNGNPLLRFDSYYILADHLEIPNLGGRAQQYLGYLCQSYIFDIATVDSPVTAAGERGWFVLYGIAAFIYRIFITFFIVIFIASKFFTLGILLAEFAVITQIILPLGKQIGFLFLSPKIRKRRLRAIGLTGTALATIALTIFYLPVPFWTRGEGVVWLPEQSQVRSGSNGTVQHLLVEADSLVEVGTPLVALEDPFLNAELEVLEARLVELKARYDAAIATDRVEAEMIDEQRMGVLAKRNVALDNAANLLVKSPSVGQFIVNRPQNLPGRFYRKGELVGYVAADTSANIRVVVTQSDILLIRQRTVGVAVKLASRPQETFKAIVNREVPAANYVLPSRALGVSGGGRIAVDPADQEGTKALEKVFQLDLAVLNDIPTAYFGERVYVRFEHGEMPLGQQWYWMGRQLFLRHFGV
ncbi:MAG: putative peptide zinc metalloprotease protein [Gammaproteobacteria bacterium]|jgi:putative peptide zinc metalloprotease protein